MKMDRDLMPPPPKPAPKPVPRVTIKVRMGGVEGLAKTLPLQEFMDAFCVGMRIIHRRRASWE